VDGLVAAEGLAAEMGDASRAARRAAGALTSSAPGVEAEAKLFGWMGAHISIMAQIVDAVKTGGRGRTPANGPNRIHC
jgi:hypothetical protein